MSRSCRNMIAAARRRAAIARQIALARQRAMDKALRDETAANIASDDVTGEDLEIRKFAVDALGDHAGSVVVMDPKSGRILTIVNQEWALRRGFKPCSTIKLVTGVAGLAENVIDPSNAENVMAGVKLDLTDSLAYSNNGYFQTVGSRVGFDGMMRYAKEFGLGEKTGINFENESPGRIPLFKSGYALNRMSSHGDDFEVTPVQLASLTSAIANGGTVLVPRVPRTIQEDSDFKPLVKRQLTLPQPVFQRLVPGMIGAVNYGTAKLAYDPLQTIAGKTGTCIGQGTWLGLFASYAPVFDPKLAVVVVTRGSGERGRVAAAVAGKIYRALDVRFGRVNPELIAGAPPILIPKPKLDPKAAAAVSDEEAEANAADAAALAGVEPEETAGPGTADPKKVVMVVPAKSAEAKPPASAPKASPKPVPSATRPRAVKSKKPVVSKKKRSVPARKPAARSRRR